MVNGIKKSFWIDKIKKQDYTPFMMTSFIILKKENGNWKQDQSFGVFRTKVEADEKVFLTIKKKNDFWTNYKVIQIEN